jgi:polyketide cyclase/dehydrase/lipid transport protein
MVAVSGEVDVNATPAEILDVIADLPRYPLWSQVHKRAAVDERYPDGHPQRATMAVTAAGLVDEQVLDYRWSAHKVSWKLVKPTGQQRDQRGSYTVTPRKSGGSHVRYDLDITPAIPLPSFVVRRVMRSAITAGTAGLRDRVESL